MIVHTEDRAGLIISPTRSFARYIALLLLNTTFLEAIQEKLGRLEHTEWTLFGYLSVND